MSAASIIITAEIERTILTHQNIHAELFDQYVIACVLHHGRH